MLSKLQNWKPYLVLVLAGGVAAAVVSIADFYALFHRLTEPQILSFKSKTLCSDPQTECLTHNVQIEALLSDSVGKTIEVDFLFELSAAGEYYVQCGESLPEREPLIDYGDGFFAFVPLSPTDCKDGFYLSDDNAVVTETAMAWVVFRTLGSITVRWGSYGGYDLYTLVQH